MAQVYNIKDFTNNQKYIFITDTNAIVGIIKEVFYIEDIPWIMLDDAAIGKMQDLQRLRTEFQTNQLFVSLGKVIAMVPCHTEP